MRLPGSARRVALDIMGARNVPPGAYDDFAQLDERDRALVKELVTGTERWKRFLDYYVSCFCHRPLEEVSPKVLNALRLGTYQIMFMGIPHYAAVDSTVRCIKSRAHRGFVNGVLRAIARHPGHVEMPSLDACPKEYAAIRYSYPDWIVERYFRAFGMQDALSLLKTQNNPPPVTLRVNTSRSERDCLLKMLHESGFSAEPGMLDVSIKVAGGRSVSEFPGYSEGLFSVQNEGAMIVTRVLDPEPGDVIWDMCAAPGGKTTHMAELVSETGFVVASDISKKRAGMITESSKRLGLSNIGTVVLDATSVHETAAVLGAAGFPLSYDKVLVDAPCSGLGVIGKHPDIKWRRRESDIPNMAKRQTLLLNTAAQFLKRGGRLVYSTCTLTHEENQEVWRNFLDAHKGFAPVSEAVSLNERTETLDMKNGCAYLLPHAHGTDGFFVARALKRHG